MVLSFQLQFLDSGFLFNFILSLWFSLSTCFCGSVAAPSLFVIIISTPICFLVGKLHMHPLGFEPHNPTLHPFLWEKEVPFELEFIVNVSSIFLSLVGDVGIATDDTCISRVLL